MPHMPHNIIMLATGFRWCRLFGVASHVAEGAKGKTTRMIVLVFRLIFLILAFAQLSHFAEWPCEALVRESDQDHVFALTASCDIGFRSFWTTCWYVFVTMSTVGY